MTSEKDIHIPRHLSRLAQAIENGENLSSISLKEGLEDIDQAIKKADDQEEAQALEDLRKQVLALYESRRNDKTKHIWLASLGALLILIFVISFVMYAYENSSSKSGWASARPSDISTVKESSSKNPTQSLESSNSETNSSAYPSNQDSASISTVTSSESNASSTESSVDTRSLTTGQVSDWVVETYLASQGDTSFTAEDYIVTSETGNDGLVYSQIAENHSSAAMQAAGADPSVNPVVGFYRVNDQGQLESSDDGGVTWAVVSDSY
ncbi:hypothetical protein [Streptococcus dentiloxodontae]